MAVHFNPDGPLSDDTLNQLRRRASHGDREAALQLHALHDTPAPGWTKDTPAETQLELPLSTQPRSST